jgi:hypothetical protein
VLYRATLTARADTHRAGLGDASDAQNSVPSKVAGVVSERADTLYPSRTEEGHYNMSGRGSKCTLLALPRSLRLLAQSVLLLWGVRLVLHVPCVPLSAGGPA